MKLCASLSSASDVKYIKKADMAEVRLDLIDHVPDILGKQIVVTFKGPGAPDLSVLPRGFRGMIDVGEHTPPTMVGVEVISSVHDFELTPTTWNIESRLKQLKGDIIKGAFKVNTFSDLKDIYDASLFMEKRHILIGMGELGMITRIRSDILKNEFTYCYVDEPTAPGQLSLEEMSFLGKDPMVVGILGHPLTKSLSPKMHNAVMEKLKIKGIYLKFDFSDLEDIEDVITDYNIKGLNVTAPHKTAILEHLDSVDKEVEAVGAANTIVNKNGVLTGYNTDIQGIKHAMRLGGFDPKGRRALIMGSGGVARACAYTLVEAGCRVTVTGRTGKTTRSLCKDLGCDYVPSDTIVLAHYDMLVNCTPVGMYADEDYPVNISKLSNNHTVFDLVYGAETPLIQKAKEVSARIVSGDDMLAAQGAASLEMWTGKKDLFEMMRGAL